MLGGILWGAFDVRVRVVVSPEAVVARVLAAGAARQSRAVCDFRLGIEWLEDRRVLSNYLVTSTDYAPTESGTLGYAIAAAMSSDDSQAQITFRLPANSTISLGGTDASANTSYGPTAYAIDGGAAVNITIDGSAAPGLTIDGGSAVRLFEVTEGALTLKNLMVEGGLAQGYAGGNGALGGAGGGGAGLGGAVLDDGSTFTAEGVTFTDNVARGGVGGTFVSGGGPVGGGGGGGLGGAGPERECRRRPRRRRQERRW